MTTAGLLLYKFPSVPLGFPLDFDANNPQLSFVPLVSVFYYLLGTTDRAHLAVSDVSALRKHAV